MVVSKIDPPGRSARQAGAKPSWLGFTAWAVVGAGASLGLLSILTIGFTVLAATVVITVFVARWRPSVAEAFGTVTGLALPLFDISYMNREGPGEVCTTNGTGGSCTDEWSPWPWLAAGVLLAIAGVAAFIAFRHRENRMRAPAAGG